MVLDHALLPEFHRCGGRCPPESSSGDATLDPNTALSTRLSTVVNDGWIGLVTDGVLRDLWCEGLTLTSLPTLLQAVIHRL